MPDNIYQDKRWKKKRAYILKRDEHVCQECKRYGKTAPATTVHHVKPLELYPELWLTDKNLISVCNKCHEGFHDRVTDRLTKSGLRLVRRIWNEIL